MVSDDTSLTLDGLLSNTSSDKPLVSGIEVLLKGEDALSLTSINDLADRYGITLGVNEAGEETLQLDDRWTKQDDGSYDFNGGAEADGGLTLETSLTPVETGDPARGEAVQQQVFTLETAMAQPCIRRRGGLEGRPAFGSIRGSFHAHPVRQPHLPGDLGRCWQLCRAARA